MTELMQVLCDEIMNLGDILACYVFDKDGRVLGTNYGEFDVDENLRTNFGTIAAQIWGGLKQVEGIGGDIEMVTARFTNFKILGIPIPNSRIAVLATIPMQIDSEVLKTRILDFVSYWRKSSAKQYLRFTARAWSGMAKGKVLSRDWSAECGLSHHKCSFQCSIKLHIGV